MGEKLNQQAEELRCESGTYGISPANVAGGGKQFTLVELLQLCHSFKSTDPRDKIFALLGLATDGNRLIRAEYNIPVKEVSVHTAFQVLRTYGELTFSVVCL